MFGFVSENLLTWYIIHNFPRFNSFTTQDLSSLSRMFTFEHTKLHFIQCQTIPKQRKVNIWGFPFYLEYFQFNFILHFPSFATNSSKCGCRSLKQLEWEISISQLNSLVCEKWQREVPENLCIIENAVKLFLLHMEKNSWVNPVQLSQVRWKTCSFSFHMSENFKSNAFN